MPSSLVTLFESSQVFGGSCWQMTAAIVDPVVVASLRPELSGAAFCNFIHSNLMNTHLC